MLPCSTVDAGVEDCWIGSSGGNADEEASDPMVEEIDAAEGEVVEGVDSGSGSLFRGRVDPGSLARECVLPWISSVSLLIRPEEGGRLLYARRFGVLHPCLRAP